MSLFRHGHRAVARALGPATWGTPDQPWGTRRSVAPEDRALIAGYRSGRRVPNFSTDFKDAARFRAEWQSDDKAGLKSCRRLENAQATPEGLQTTHACGARLPDAVVDSFGRQQVPPEIWVLRSALEGRRYRRNEQCVLADDARQIRDRRNRIPPSELRSHEPT